MQKLKSGLFSFRVAKKQKRTVGINKKEIFENCIILQVKINFLTEIMCVFQNIACV